MSTEPAGEPWAVLRGLPLLTALLSDGLSAMPVGAPRRLGLAWASPSSGSVV